MINKKVQPILAAERADVLRAKKFYGMSYGMAAGLSFAVFCWGFDSYILSQHNGLMPWLKFGLGAILCAIPGGVTGWYAAKFNKPAFAMLLWLVYAVVFAWLTVYLPLVIFPRALTVIQPELADLLHYAYYDEFGARMVVAYTWLAIFVSLTGLLQIPLADNGVFSSSIFGKVGPMLLVAVLMGISGSLVDNGLINEPLRSATVAIDNTIQFIVDNRGLEVDKAEARRMHAGAFRAIDPVVTGSRELIVSGYNGLLEEINVLVKFENDWVECQVFYNQPITCKVVQEIE